jgi:hypothetical protein
MKRLHLTLLALSACFAGNAQLVTQPLKAAKDTANGIVYALPAVALEIEVDTRCTEEAPGPYFQYAERFLGTKDVRQTESTHYALKGFRLKTSTLPDPQQTYVISTGKKAKGWSIQLTEQGFLRAINGKVVPPVASAVKSSPKATRSEDRPWETAPSSIFTKDMQLASSTAKMAELAANQLFAIRDARFNLLTQESDKTPSDGSSYRTVLSELNRMESAYRALFEGSQKQTFQTHTFTWYPEKDTVEILFRFSALKGILGADNLAGSPYYLCVRRLPETADAYKVDRSAALKGIYYRRPAKAVIEITDGKDVAFSQEVTLPQCGNVMSLPASQIGSVDLDPNTGALLRVSK